MAIELKCPKCGGRLVYWGATGALLRCPQCEFGWGNEELWQELIQTKKELEIVKKALNDAKQTLLYCWDTYDIHSAKCTAEDVEKALE